MLILAAKGGYGVVQVRAVAERAGIAVGTLYCYFPSKNHLPASALTRQFHRLRAARDWTATAGPPQQHWNSSPAICTNAGSATRCSPKP